MASVAFQRWYERFSSTGDICPIRLGMSGDDLRVALGEPDDVGGTSRKHRKPAIWVYGGLEFHFDHTAGGELFLIYRDTADGIVKTSIGRRYKRMRWDANPLEATFDKMKADLTRVKAK